MGSAPFALFQPVIHAPVFGRAYSAAPTLFHADLYGILRKLEGESPKYFARRGRIIPLPKCRVIRHNSPMQPFERFPLGRAGNRLQDAI